MTTAPTLAIETSQLTKFFGQQSVLDNLSLNVAPGKFYGFLRPNVAGKSTTIKMLTGLLQPNGGSKVENIGNSHQLCELNKTLAARIVCRFGNCYSSKKSAPCGRCA